MGALAPPAPCLRSFALTRVANAARLFPLYQLSHRSESIFCSNLHHHQCILAAPAIQVLQRHWDIVPTSSDLYCYPCTTPFTGYYHYETYDCHAGSGCSLACLNLISQAYVSTQICGSFRLFLQTIEAAHDAAIAAQSRHTATLYFYTKILVGHRSCLVSVPKPGVKPLLAGRGPDLHKVTVKTLLPSAQV